MREPTLDDYYLLIYTSGTTGNPKGVIGTQKGFLSCVHHYEEEKNTGVGPGSSHLSYLPMAHIYEQLMVGLSLSIGMKVGYFSGDPLKLLEDV